MNIGTLDQLMAWGPCLSRSALLTLTRGRKKLTPAEICDLDAAAAEQRLWVLLRPELIPEPTLHELVCQFAERALIRERTAGREPDPALWDAIAAKRAWLKGEITADELARARAAAVSAANAANAAWDAALRAADAVYYAAMSGAWSAADSADSAPRAAENAAWSAANTAASAATSAANTADSAADAAYHAGWSAEREWQLGQLRLLLSEEN